MTASQRSTPHLTVTVVGSKIFMQDDQRHLDVYTPPEAIGAATMLTETVAGMVRDQAPDLADHLDRAAEALHSTLAAWQPTLHPTPAVWHPNPYQRYRDWPAVPSEVTAICDNTSVGAVITDPDGRVLLSRRVKPPKGWAPPAGHIDDHDGPQGAAQDEVHEEVGLTVTSLTRVLGPRWRPGPCRRHHGPHGPGHEWTVYRADVTGDITPDPDEATGSSWHSCAQVQALADHTVALAHGADLDQGDGLEPVWVLWFAELGLITASLTDVAAVARLATHSPYAASTTPEEQA